MSFLNCNLLNCELKHFILYHCISKVKIVCVKTSPEYQKYQYIFVTSINFILYFSNQFRRHMLQTKIKLFGMKHNIQESFLISRASIPNDLFVFQVEYAKLHFFIWIYSTIQTHEQNVIRLPRATSLNKNTFANGIWK